MPKKPELIFNGTAIDKCQVCSSGNLEFIISLGHHPPVQAYITKKQLQEPEVRFPLDLFLCKNCGLVQIGYAPDPRIVFPPEYPYQTGMTRMLVDNFTNLANLLIEKFKLTDNDLAIDIGSNDGTFLKGFKTKGLRVLGVEPTDIAKIAENNGIPTVQEYFSKEVAEKIVAGHGKAKIVAATNVFAHVNNLPSMVPGIRELLTDDGWFVTESQYLIDIMDKLEYDTIYHEHLRYYSLKPLIELHKNFGLNVVDAERITASGGSIRVFATKQDLPQTERLKKLLEDEEGGRIYYKERLDEFAKKIKDSKNKLMELLFRIKNEGNRIVGVGAPARGSTILNYCNIDSNILDYIVEKRGSLKIGLFTPGTHVPIVDEERMFKEQPEYALLLSWHIGEELMKKLKELGYKGNFIMPLPEPRVVEI